MPIDDKLRQELIRDEGLRLISYKDSVGLWTIGVGHLLGKERRMTEITAWEAMALLEFDIQIAEEMLRRLFLVTPVMGDEVRYRALVNMAFNLGGRLAGFVKFIAAIKAKDWAAAGVAMMDSKWATQVGARAERLHKMIVEGVV